MPVFDYRAYDQAGMKKKGILDAASTVAARQLLRERNLFPISIEVAQGGQRKGKHHLRVPPREIWPFTRQLATLLDAGLPLTESLDALAMETTHRAMKTVISELKESVRHGDTLHASLARYPRLFSSVYINMVKAGEESANLDVVLERLADFGERQQAVTSKIRASLTYPIFVSCLGIIILAFLFAYIIPKVTTIFTEMQQTLPWPTRLLINGSDLLARTWFGIPLFFILCYFLYTAIQKNPLGKARTDTLLLRLPLFGTLFRHLTIARLADTMGGLLSNGVPLATALGIVQSMFTNTKAVELITTMSNDISHGKNISVSMRRATWVPASVVQMVAAGEKSNKLDKMLQKIAAQYDRESEQTITALTSLLEPAMIVVMGAIVGFVVLAILLPIFDMQTLIH